ncbi:hypothetical protein QCI41_02810 [Bacillus cereus group sp. MG4]
MSWLIFMTAVFYLILSNQNLRFMILISFKKKPVFNEIGEDFWGTSRFKAPEEYELHAQITSETNVYVLAGIAFAFIGGKNDKSFEKWESTQELYNICKKALHKEKNKRYRTIQAFYETWLTNIE